MSEEHAFTPRIVWTGNRGQGTKAYRSYDRTWQLETPGQRAVDCSNDPRLGGDPSLPNPEELLIAALSSCHMLWYLHLASKAGIAVMHYADDPIGTGESTPDGAGRFIHATLRPEIHVPSGTNIAKADAIHGEVHRYCFIAQSVNFPVAYEAHYIEL